MFLFVGVSLFFVSSYTISIGTRIQPNHWKRSEPKPSRQVHNRRFYALTLILQCVRAVYVCVCFFFIARLYLPYFSSCSMYSRLNVLVVSLAEAQKKRSFHSFSDIQNTFLPSFPFVYFRYMNERQIRCYTFFFFHSFTIMPMIVPSFWKTNKQKNSQDKYIWFDSGQTTCSLYADIYLSLALALWYQCHGSDSFWSITFFAASGPKKRLCNSSNY